MSFTVNAAGLAGLPDQLDRLQLDALRGSAYVGDHAKLSYGGVLNDITADHERIRHDVRGFLEKLGGPVAGNTGEAVRAAMTYYAHADAKAAASLDAACPGTTSAHADVASNYGATSYSSSALGARFRDVATPRSSGAKTSSSMATPTSPSSSTSSPRPRRVDSSSSRQPSWRSRWVSATGGIPTRRFSSRSPATGAGCAPVPMSTATLAMRSAP